MTQSMLLLMVLTCLTVTTTAGTSCDKFSAAQPPLKIASFNVQILGQTKFEKKKVIEVVVMTILRYDVVLIMEIRDKADTVLTKILEIVNIPRYDNKTYTPYKLVKSARLGRTNSKEQYAFFYRERKLQLTDTYQYPDIKDVFQREPFAVRFTSPHTEINDFAIAAIHTDPGDAVNETSHLAGVYDAIKARWNLEDVLIAGDFNSDCTYVKQNQWKNIILWTDSRFKWLVDNCLDTTVGSTDCAYDRFVAAGQKLQRAVVPGSVGVYRFDAEPWVKTLGINPSEVSDHYPIEMELHGKYCTSRIRTVVTSESFTVEGVGSSGNVRQMRAIYRDIDYGFDISRTYTSSGAIQEVIARKVIKDGTAAVNEIIKSVTDFYYKFPDTVNAETVKIVQAHTKARFLGTPFVYGLKKTSRMAYEINIVCRLQKPSTCRVTVEKRTS